MSDFCPDSGYHLFERDNDGCLMVASDCLRMAMTPEGALRMRPQYLLLTLPLAVHA